MEIEKVEQVGVDKCCRAFWKFASGLPQKLAATTELFSSFVLFCFASYADEEIWMKIWRAWNTLEVEETD